MILEFCELGDWRHVSSEMARIEVEANPDATRRGRVRLLLPRPDAALKLTDDVFARAEELQELGFKPADAVHVAAAEAIGADVFPGCDDRLCRTARQRQADLKVRVANPLDWLEEARP